MNQSGPRRVVITGMSVICPLGNSLESLWQSLLAGTSGVRRLVADGEAELALRYGAPAAQFTGKIEDFGPLDKDRQRAIRKGLKLMCREIQMGVAAAQLALHDAGLAPGIYDPDRIGVVYGCDHVVTLPDEFVAGMRACRTENQQFNYDQWAREGMPKVTPLWLLKYLPNMPASHIAIYNDLRGPNNSITYREASGNLAVAEATATIQRGSADQMLAGATGCSISPLKSIFVSLQHEMARNTVAPRGMSRPFDLHRTGMVAGEGAAALMLETHDSAVRRGAPIYGEIGGYGSSIVLNARGVANTQQAIENALKAALRSADLAPDQLCHLHAHGLATRHSDREEARAIAAVAHDRTAPLPVVAAKSYFGNLGAASGLVELISSVMALRGGQLFPILNYETPDPECPIHAVTRWSPSADGWAVNVNATPQGQASAVIVRGGND